MFVVEDNEFIEVKAYYTDDNTIYALIGEELITYPNIEHNKAFLDSHIREQVECFKEFLDFSHTLPNRQGLLSKLEYLKDYTRTILGLPYLRNICFLTEYLDQYQKAPFMMITKELELDNTTVAIENPLGISNMLDIDPVIIHDVVDGIKKYQKQVRK